MRAAADSSVPEAVHAAWARAEARWDDPAAHDELLGLVAANTCYAWAAGRYRARGDGDAIAQQQIERLRRAAEVTMYASAAPRAAPKERPYRAATSVLVMLVVAIAAGLLYAMVMRGMAPPAPSAQPMPAQPLQPIHKPPGQVR